MPPLPGPWTPPEVRPDGRDSLGRPRARLAGVPLHLLSAGPSSCRWATPPGHRLVLEGGRLGLQRDGGPGCAEILLRAPFRRDADDGGLAEALAAACALAPRGAALAAALASHPAAAWVPEGTRLHLHDLRTFSIGGRVLIGRHLRIRDLARWLGPALAPLDQPWRLVPAALEIVAAPHPPSGHERLRLMTDAVLLSPGLRRALARWSA